MNTSKKPTIIILHGWGLRGNVYENLSKLLKKEGHRVYSLDLPGFGTEPLRKPGGVRLSLDPGSQDLGLDKRGGEGEDTGLNLDDYVAFVRSFIEKNKLTKPILVGHSFGGRVAIKYTWKYPKDVAKLILTGVPVIRHTSFKKKIAFIVAIVGGSVFNIFPKDVKNVMRKVLYKVIGEWDYYKAGPLKEVFKNIIGEDLVEYAKKVSVATFLIWGADDRLVPVSDVEKIKKYIPHANVFVIKGEGHKLPYTNPQAFFNAIKSIL